MSRTRILKSVLALSSAAAVLAAADARAQDAAADPAAASVPAQDEGAANEIVVKGFRASLNSALNLKRNETATIDAIKAEDIAEFPDLNLAESLQRIPGVAISRVNGEGRNISIAAWARNIAGCASTGWKRSAPPAAPTIRAA